MNQIKAHQVLAMISVAILILLSGCTTNPDPEPGPYPVQTEYFTISRSDLRLSRTGDIDLFETPPLAYPLDNSLVVQFVGSSNCIPEFSDAILTHTPGGAIGAYVLLLVMVDSGPQECTADLAAHSYEITPTTAFYERVGEDPTPNMPQLAQSVRWMLDSDPNQTFQIELADTASVQTDN